MVSHKLSNIETMPLLNTFSICFFYMKPYIINIIISGFTEFPL